MAEVPFRPVRQLSEYKGKGASVSRENGTRLTTRVQAHAHTLYLRFFPLLKNLVFFPDIMVSFDCPVSQPRFDARAERGLGKSCDVTFAMTSFGEVNKWESKHMRKMNKWENEQMGKAT